jgi:hypothetical protein
MDTGELGIWVQMGFRGRARDWAGGSERLGRSGPGCGLLKLNWDKELRGRQWTSEDWAENSFGPKKERRKEIPFYFQKSFS